MRQRDTAARGGTQQVAGEQVDQALVGHGPDHRPLGEAGARLVRRIAFPCPSQAGDLGQSAGRVGLADRQRHQHDRGPVAAGCQVGRVAGRSGDRGLEGQPRSELSAAGKQLACPAGHRREHHIVHCRAIFVGHGSRTGQIGPGEQQAAARSQLAGSTTPAARAPRRRPAAAGAHPRRRNERRGRGGGVWTGLLPRRQRAGASCRLNICQVPGGGAGRHSGAGRGGLPGVVANRAPIIAMAAMPSATA